MDAIRVTTVRPVRRFKKGTPMELRRYAAYTRRDSHDLFDPLSPFTPQSGTWGMQGTVRLQNRARDWVFFVTFGRRQSGHQFEEEISPQGVLTWQSQPHQRLMDRTIGEWTHQDHARDNIFLFLRRTPTIESSSVV